ncbi:MAG: alpha/beta hydrolase [Butyrivibrio sp.]|nr:alpha/beta hydrolase [Butyrivibrio sp.]
MKADKLAVVFPGMGYHIDKPLLYYSKKLAKARGYEVVGISYDFQIRAKDIMNDKETKNEAFLHAVSETEKQLASVNYADFKDILFIGKSIGTTVAAYFDRKNGINARQVVFTPVPETFDHLRDNCGVVFHGTADPWCETALAESKCEELHMELFKVAGANHSLETDDPIIDCCRMQGILEKVNDMLV